MNEDETDLSVEANLNKFADALGVKLYPFKQPEEVTNVDA